MHIRTVSVVLLLASGSALGSGCSMSDLRNTNRQLRDSNDRLLSENNRLEQDLARAERAIADREAEIDQLQGLLRNRREAPPVEPRPEDDFRGLGLESETTTRGTVVRLDSAVFFPSGKAALSARGQRILDDVAQILNTTYRGRTIRVEGHTDDRPVRKVRHLYPSNWELSTARACSVVRYLEGNGMDPNRVYPAGFSFHRPRSPGKTDRARQMNRRVEILILRDGAS